MKQIDAAVEFLKGKLDASTADEYEIYVESARTLTAESKNGGVESFARSHELGAAIRLVKGGRSSMASSSALTPEPLTHMVAEAEEALAEVDVSDSARLPQPQPGIVALGERPGVPLHEVPDDDKIAVARTLEQAVLDAGPDIARARQPRYSEEILLVGVCSSCGIDERAQRSMIACDVQAVAERDGVSETASESEHAIRFEDVDAAAIGARAGRRAQERLGASDVPTGRYRVYVEPRAAAALVRIAMPSFFANNVQRGASRLAGKRKRELFSNKVTVVDDGIMAGGVGSFPFDGEGVWHRRTTLVHEGVIEGWLYDAASAQRDAVPSTGNALRDSIHNLPRIAVTNGFIDVGGAQPSSLMASCDGGLCISELVGLHTANTVSGDISLGAMGFTVEGGSRGRPVRGIILAGNVFDMLRSVDGVGDDLRFFGRYGAPSLTMPDVQIGGR